MRRLGPVVLVLLVLAGCGGHSTSAAGGTATKSTPAPTPAPTPTRDANGIPDDFPLAQDLVADGDSTVSKPQHRVQGVRLQRACWGAAWPGASVDRLVVQQVGPELGVTRELALYADPATASAVFAKVRAGAAHCRRLPATSGQSALDVTREGDADAGASDRTTTFAETLAGGRPGGAVFVFTQVGRAVLATEDGGEWTRASATRGTRDRLRAERPVAARLCVFRQAGC